MRWGIIKWEKEHGYTGRFIAKRIGCSDVQWSRIKSGKQQPTYDQLLKLRDEFNIENILDLMKEDNNEEEAQESCYANDGNVA